MTLSSGFSSVNKLAATDSKNKKEKGERQKFKKFAGKKFKTFPDAYKYRDGSERAIALGIIKEGMTFETLEAYDGSIWFGNAERCSRF